jgi:hypothetical protein
MTTQTTETAYRVRYTSEFGAVWHGRTYSATNTITGESTREQARAEARYARAQIYSNAPYWGHHGSYSGVQVVPA